MFSSLVNGAFNLIGAGLGIRQSNKEMNFNANEAAKNREYQTAERLAAQEYNTDMFNKANEYNSIGSQVNRALAAGINPNMLFGNGGYSSATASPMSSQGQAGSSASYSSSLASGFLTSFAQNALALANVNKAETEADLNKYDLTWNRMTEGQRYESLMNLNAKTKAEIKKIFSDVGMNDFNKDLQERTFKWFAGKSEAEIDVMKEQLNFLRNQSLDILKGIDLKDANIRKLFSDIGVNRSQISLNAQNIKESESRIAVNDANVQNLNASTANLDASTTNLNASTSNIYADTEGKNINNAIQKIVKDFSQITGIPLGASESQAIFALWKQGRFDEVSDKLLIQNYSSTSSNIFDQLRKSLSGISLSNEATKRTWHKRAGDFLGEWLQRGYNSGNPQLESMPNP